MKRSEQKEIVVRKRTNEIDKKIGGIVENSLKKVNKRPQNHNIKRMWQNFRSKLSTFSTLRGIISELAPLVKHAYPVFGLTPLVRSLPSAPLHSPRASCRLHTTSSVESIKIDDSPVANSTPSFRLVTGYYGISKEIFYGKVINFDKTKTTYGDDSW